MNDNNDISLKEEEDDDEEEEEEEEEFVPRFIPKSERTLLHNENQIKKNNENKIQKNVNKPKENKNINEKKETKNENIKKDEENNKKTGQENIDKEKDEEEKLKKEKEKEEDNILKNNILSIRNRLDKIHQQNIKYLIELEKKKNSEKKQNIIGLDDDDGDTKTGKNKLIGKQKKLKSQQEKIYIHLPDDTDDQNDITEYNNWKERELKRIKRDIEKYEAYLKNQEEIKKRRLMSESEIKEDNLRLGADSTKNRFRSKISFLQKYYHKGVFFQDEAEDDPNHIYNRDFNLPTWEDTIDKSNLPKLLAKRRGNVWKKSQSKYTHLNDADTTNFDKNFVVPENILAKIQRFSGKK